MRHISRQVVTENVNFWRSFIFSDADNPGERALLLIIEASLAGMKKESVEDTRIFGPDVVDKKIGYIK